MKKRYLGIILLMCLTLSACGNTAQQNSTSIEEPTTEVSTETTETTETTEVESEEEQGQEEYTEESMNLNKTYTLADIEKAITDDYNAMEIVEWIDDNTTYYTILTQNDDYMYYEIDTEHYVTDYKLNTSSIIHKYNDTEHEVYLYLDEDSEPFVAQHYILDKSKITDLVEPETDLAEVKDTFKASIISIISTLKANKTSCEYVSTDLIVHDYYDIVHVFTSDGTKMICYINVDTGQLDAIEYDVDYLTYVITNMPIINTDLYEYKDYKESEYNNLVDYFKFNYEFVHTAYTREDTDLFEIYEKELEETGITLDKVE